jgi:hypothetical protein
LGLLRVQAAVEAALVVRQRSVLLVVLEVAVVSIIKREVRLRPPPKVLQVVLDILEHKLVAWVVAAVVLGKLEQQEDWLVLV